MLLLHKEANQAGVNIEKLWQMFNRQDSSDSPSLQVLGNQLIHAILPRAPTVSIAYWPAVTKICPFIYSWFIIIVLLSITQNNDAFLGLKSKVTSVDAWWIGLADCTMWKKVGATSETSSGARRKKGQEKLQRSRSAWKKRFEWAFTWMDNNRNQLY